MIDIVFPKNNEGKFLEMANKLGYSDLCFAYKSGVKKAKFTASFSDKKADLILASFDNNVSKKVDIVLGVEGQKISNAFFKAAAEKNVLLGLSFSAIAKSKNKLRVISSIKYIIRVARKSKTRLLIASFADDPFLMRAPLDLQSLFCVLGMNPGEAKQAMNAAQERIELNRKTRNTGVEGIEIIGSVEKVNF